MSNTSNHTWEDILSILKSNNIANPEDTLAMLKESMGTPEEAVRIIDVVVLNYNNHKIYNT